MYQAAWRGYYWASIAVIEGASERISAALRGGQAVCSYNPTDALQYVWNRQYYIALAQSTIAGNMDHLIAGIRLAYNKINSTQAFRSLNSTDAATLQASLNAIQAKATNIRSASFGTVLFFNTVAMAMSSL